MVRIPYGWHRQTGTQRSTMQRSGRIPSPGQENYWRQQLAELHASTPPITIPAAGHNRAAIGPHGAGEIWEVDLVQVFTSSQYAQAPLVVQQMDAQTAGTTATPPPPVVAQVWLSASGVLLHLLGQTTSGGNDTIGVSSPPLTAGQRITVQWYGANPGDSAWAVLKGTRTALDL